MTIDEVRHYVAQRKLIYQRSLAQADKMLQSLVAQDPKRLAECQAVQADYAAGVAGLTLRALEQPGVPETRESAVEAVAETVADKINSALRTRRRVGLGVGDGGEPVK